MNPQFQILLQQAISVFQLGDVNSAELTLGRLLLVDSKCLPALHLLGLIKATQLKHKEAAELLGKAVRINPQDSSLQYNLAKALMESGADKEAMTHHKRAVDLAPNNPDAWLNFGKSASTLGQYHIALSHFEKALNLRPTYTEAYLNMGVALKELKHYNDALASIEKAISINSQLETSWSNQGVVLKEMRRYEEAIASYDKAISLNPNYPEAWSNKGNTLTELKRYEEAIASYDKAISLNPNYPEAWSNKGNTLTELKRYEEAIVAYEKAITLKHEKNHFLGNLIHTKMVVAAWDNFDSDVSLLMKKINSGERVSQPFPLLSIIDDPALHLKAAKIFVHDKFPASQILPGLKKLSHQKIRIGYFSPDFKNHPVSLLLAEVFELHDRSRFEIYAFSLQPASSGDPVRARLIRGFDRFIDAEGMSDLEVAQLARDLEIDIAIDLGGHTQHARTGIFSHRAAPIQVNYLGYPGTSGAEYIDYVIGDTTLIPEASQGFYTEKVIYLPNSYMTDDSARLPSIPTTRADAGLPENAFVFCCFNNSYKFNLETLRSWAKILLNVPQSVLWVSENNASFRRNLLQEFSNLGIGSERIIFAKRIDSMAEHLGRYCLADLFLDTLPFNAHTTAMDALKAGLPILTLIGNAFAGRVAASLLNAIKLPELITKTREKYESLAIELARNPTKLTAIKQELVNNQSSTALLNTSLFTEHLEEAYIKIYQHYQLDLAPECIEI